MQKPVPCQREKSARAGSRGVAYGCFVTFCICNYELQKTNCLESTFFNNTVWRVEFVSDRMSYIVLRGRWCNIMVLNMHAPSGEKSDNLKDSFYEELEKVSIIFLDTI